MCARPTAVARSRVLAVISADNLLCVCTPRSVLRRVCVCFFFFYWSGDRFSFLFLLSTHTHTQLYAREFTRVRQKKTKKIFNINHGDLLNVFNRTKSVVYRRFIAGRSFEPLLRRGCRAQKYVVSHSIINAARRHGKKITLYKKSFM